MERNVKEKKGMKWKDNILERKGMEKRIIKRIGIEWKGGKVNQWKEKERIGKER